MIIADAHVHLYDCFELNALFQTAYANLRDHALQYGDDEQSFDGVLFLVSGGADRGPKRFEQNHAPRARIQSNEQWWVEPTRERETFIAVNSAGHRLWLITGRQIVTKENIEVLALATHRSYRDGEDLQTTIERIASSMAITVLPWGVGKWLGERGRLVERALKKPTASPLFVGDNSARPRLWPRPKLFGLAEKQHIKILPGSDPLPLPKEYQKIGTYGFIIRQKLDEQQPLACLRHHLKDHQTATQPFGLTETLSRFIYNQLIMNLRRF